MRGFDVVKALKHFYPKEPIVHESRRIVYHRGKRTQLQLQPFGHKLFRGIALAHERFLTRTVMVQDNDVDTSMRQLNRFLTKEGLLGIMRRSKYFERPHHQRNRMSWEFAQGVYQEDMQRKIKFVMRKNRANPFPGIG